MIAASSSGEVWALDTTEFSRQTTSMDKLASMQASLSTATPDADCDNVASHPQETFAALGGEAIQGSGFEHEQPEPGFEEEEVS